MLVKTGWQAGESALEFTSPARLSWNRTPGMPENNPSASAGGRPPFEATPAQRQMVEAMAGYGIPKTDIAAVVGIATKTLRKHFRIELDTGHIKANAKVAGNLYRIATGNGREAVTAAIF